MITQCPEPTQLTRVHVGGGDAAVAAHAETCSSCGPEWRELALLAELTREIAWQRPARDRVVDVRSRVVASFAAPRPARRAGYVVAGGVALAMAAAIALWIARDGDDGEATTVARAAAVRPLPRADFALTGTRPDERVRLFDGAIAIDVGAVGVGERFRVIVGDAEVEARGASLEVTAEGDRLIAVRVHRGVVAIRPQFGASVTIAAGERWEATIVDAPDPEPTPAPVIEPTPAPVRGDSPARERRATRRSEPPPAEPAAPPPEPLPSPPPPPSPSPSPTSTPSPSPSPSPSPVQPPATTAPVKPARDRDDALDDRRQERREDQREQRRDDRRDDRRQERRQERRLDRRDRQ